MNEDISDIRERKKKEIREKIKERDDETTEEKQKDAESQLEMFYKQATTEEARKRLNRFKISKDSRQQIAEGVKRQIANQYRELKMKHNNGQIRKEQLKEAQVDEQKMKNILKKVSEQNKTSYNIRRS